MRMKITLEAEVVDERAPVYTPAIYRPGTTRLLFRVLWDPPYAAHQEFTEETFFATDKARSVFDYVATHLFRSMKSALVSYIEGMENRPRTGFMPVVKINWEGPA